MNQLISDSVAVISSKQAVQEILNWINFGQEIDEENDLDERDWETINFLQSLVFKVTTSTATHWYREFGPIQHQQLIVDGITRSSVITSITSSIDVAEGFGEAWEILVPSKTPLVIISLFEHIPAEFLSGYPFLQLASAENEGLLGPGTFVVIGPSKLLFVAD